MRNSPLLFSLLRSVNSFCRPCLYQLGSMYSKILFLKPSPFFDISNQKSFLSSHSNTVILPAISQTTRFFKPIFVSLGSSKKRDNTALTFKIISQYCVYIVSIGYFLLISGFFLAKGLLPTLQLESVCL